MAYPRQHKRRGSIMGFTMLFFVMVTVAGAALLSMSTITRIRTVRNGIDVRLMIAAEGAIETARGRFTLVKGVQDDWTWISDTTWTDIGTFTVNGNAVQVQALRYTGDSVPRARLRARASASGVTRVVEITVKVASFSDYAVFAGGSSSLGQDYKLVGNYYNNGNLSVPYTGARIFGRTEVVGTVSVTAPGETLLTVFPNSQPTATAAVPFPTDVAEWDYMKGIADTEGYVFAENTLEIILNGSNFTRWYIRRRATATAGVGTRPTGQINDTGSSWIATSTGVVNYTNSSISNPYLVNADYELVSETLDIPDEGVIYIQSGAPSGITLGPLVGAPWNRDNLALSPRTNGFTQQSNLNNIGSFYSAFANAGGYGVASGYTPILLLSGTIADRRVSLVCDHRIVVKQPVAYQGNLTTPDNRRFFNDGASGKQSDTAMDMHEMLGVMSKTEIHPTPHWWTPLPAAQRVTGSLAGETLPGHDYADIKSANADYCMDGVYLAINRLAPTKHYGQASGTGPLGELWYCGGLICQGSYGGGNGNTYYRRNYDWDWRMNITMPPYFLRAYNATAKFVPGTWRSWTE